MTATGPRAARRKLAHEAYQLRCMGHTWHQIAEAKGYASPQSAQKIVSRYIARMPAEDQAMARALAAGTYQLVIGRLSDLAEEAGDAGDRQTAVKALLGIADVKERHVRLTGLPAPVAQRLDVTVHQSPAAVIDRAEAQLLELMASRAPAAPGALEPKAPAVIDAEVVELEGEA